MKSCISAEDRVLCLSATIDDDSLKDLMELGLNTRFPNECETWKTRRREIKKHIVDTLSNRRAEAHAKLERDLADINVKLREAVTLEVLKAFP